VSERIEGLSVHAFEVPTDGPDGEEQDGTMTWSSTTMVLVEAHGGGQTGLGYTYADASAAALVSSKLASVVGGMDALAPAAAWRAMFAALRNAGQPGPGAMAVSAVDIALWDLKARLLGQPLHRVLPGFRDEVPVYGSGGFTNYPESRLVSQVAAWAAEGIGRMKIKTSQGWSTACRPTSPGAAASPACCRWAGWPRPGRSTCPGTARPRSARMRCAACRGCGTWSTSTPTSGWRPWPSRAR
jgi:L-alanine-DL-glutamate epimerase-like enolase superfamily enzyme